MPRFYVYLIHTNSKLADHAHHYLGATSDLRGRLIAHAKGRGAKITQAYRAAGIAWTVAAVFEISHKNPFQAEQRAKRFHRSRRFCPLCSGDEAKGLRGAVSLDTSLLGIPLTSAELAALPTADDLPL